MKDVKGFIAKLITAGAEGDAVYIWNCCTEAAGVIEELTKELEKQTRKADVYESAYNELYDRYVIPELTK